MTSVHFDERDDAEGFVDRVRAAGLGAELHRDVFAGEDDLEDAAWIVEVRGGPLTGLDLGPGWSPDQSATPPESEWELPSAPRRLKNSARAE